MNRIDAFFVMAALYLIWLFVVFLVPAQIMQLVYVAIAAWSVGVFIGNVPRRLAKETDRDSFEYMFKLANDQFRLMDNMMSTLDEAKSTINSQRAKIDALMFEYCPDEMTPEQIGNYWAHVRAVSQQEEDEVEKALRH